MPLYILVVLLLSLLLLLLVFLIGGKSKKGKGRSSWDSLREIEGVSYSTCPLCKSSLKRSEKVLSHLYPGKPDGLMHIFGCPYCHGEKKDYAVKRICPYCKMHMREKDYVIARVFEKPGKTQVHVLGCTLCRDQKLT